MNAIDSSRTVLANAIRPQILKPVSAAIALVFLTACSETADSVLATNAGPLPSNGAASSTLVYKLTGTVPGTLIEAFCENGTYYSTNSSDNGGTENPFELTLPAATTCRIVMTMNEDDPANTVVVPLSFTDQAGVNGATITSNGVDIDIDYVDLPADRATMLLDANGDGVEDAPAVVTLDPEADEAAELTDGADDGLDDDNDGIVDSYEDNDNDGIHNQQDDDDDNDGVPDDEDDDDDNDGVPDNDNDNDGVPNGEDADDDNDGLTDDIDSDDDNDGIEDDEDDDDDNDGTDDVDDEDELNDSDDDGINDEHDDDLDSDDLDDTEVDENDENEELLPITQ